MVDGKVLFKVRGVTGFPADFRAKNMANRIIALAKDKDFTPEMITTNDIDIGTQILVKDKVLFMVVDADALVEGVERKVLATVWIYQINQAIKEYKEARTFKRIMINVFFLLLATFILGITLWVTHFLYNFTDKKLEIIYKEKFSGIELKSFRLIKSEKLLSMLHSSVKIFWVGLGVLASVIYINFSLSLFPWTYPIAQILKAWLVMPLVKVSQGIFEAIPQLIFILILILIARFILKLIRMFFKRLNTEEIKLQTFDKEWAWPTYRLIRLLVIIFTVVLAYPHIPGSDSDAFKGVSILLGVVFSLGSSSAVANIIAGYSMIYRRAFKVGDRVKIGEYIGDVKETRLLVTYLRSLKNEEIVIPNSKILNNEVINYTTLTKSSGLIIHEDVSIGYNVAWRQVDAMLKEAVARTQGFETEPEPFVLIKKLNDVAVVYEVNAYCKDPKVMFKLKTMLKKNILDVFNEYGVEILTPHFHKEPNTPHIVAPKDWYPPPASPPDSQNP